MTRPARVLVPVFQLDPERCRPEVRAIAERLAAVTWRQFEQGLPYDREEMRRSIRDAVLAVSALEQAGYRLYPAGVSG